MTLTYVHPPDGTRYYDLSAQALAEAEQLAPTLIAFGRIPVRMPNDKWLYPAPPTQLDLFNPPGGKLD